MNGNANNGPMLKAAGLWAKSSVKGGQYLTGRLGGVKVLVLENRDRKGDNDPSHHLFFVEAAPRQGGQERGDGARGAHQPLTGQRPSQPQQSGSGVQGHAEGADWQAPLRQDGSSSLQRNSFEDRPEWER